MHFHSEDEEEHEQGVERLARKHKGVGRQEGGVTSNKDKPKKEIAMKHILDKLKNTEDNELKLRLFFMIVIRSYLLPGASSSVNEKAVMHTRNMDSISQIDWSRVVYEDLRNSVKNWHQPLKRKAPQMGKEQTNRKRKTSEDPNKPRKPSKTIHGCYMVPLV